MLCSSPTKLNRDGFQPEIKNVKCKWRKYARTCHAGRGHGGRMRGYGMHGCILQASERQ